MKGVMTASESTADLVKRAGSGDRSAFDELIRRERQDLLSAIRSRMGSHLQGRVDPEDVLQDTALRAFTLIGEFRWQGEASFRNWLESIAAKRVLHLGRLHARRDELLTLQRPPTDSETPSRRARRAERLERLKASVEGLSPDYRTVIQLARIEGLKVREIAERMGRSESAIKNLLLRAMKQLRETFPDTESLGLPQQRSSGDENRGD